MVCDEDEDEDDFRRIEVGCLRANVYSASSDCVVVLTLGDLVAWRHYVMVSRGHLSVLLSSYTVNGVYGVSN